MSTLPTPLVQLAAGSGAYDPRTGSSQATASFGFPNAPGNLLVVFVGLKQFGAGGTSLGGMLPCTISDTDGNIYVQAGILQDGGNSRGASYLFVCQNALGNTTNTGNTVNAMSSLSDVNIIAHEYAGSWVQDGTPYKENSDLGGDLEGSVVTTAAGDLLVGFAYNDQPNDLTIRGSGFAPFQQAQIFCGGYDGVPPFTSYPNDDSNIAPAQDGSFGEVAWSFDGMAGAAGTYAINLALGKAENVDRGNTYNGFLIAFSGNGTVPMPTGSGPDVVTDICRRAGIPASQIDTTLLLTPGLIQPTNVVGGYLIERPTEAANILSVLMKGYLFDACERDGAMRWIPRGAAPVITIPEADLGLASDKAKLVTQIAQEIDLPRRVRVLYNDPELDYQQGQQEKLRTSRTIQSKVNVLLSMPLTLSGDFARQLAEKTLHIAWIEKTSFNKNLWKALYLLLDPTDVIEFVYEGFTFRVRLIENALGVGFVVSLKSVLDATQVLTSAQTGGSAAIAPTPPVAVANVSLLWALDIPLIEDTDANPAVNGTGWYAAISSGLLPWPGAVLYESSDDTSWNDIDASTVPVNFANAVNTLAAPRSPYSWDDVNTLTIRPMLGTPAGDTDLNVLNGSNRILVGSEIVSYVNVTDNGDGTFTLSRLLRGQRGTEWAVATHGANELVLGLNVGLLREQEPAASIAVPEFLRAATAGQDVSSASSVDFTLRGNDLKPYAVAQVTGTRSGGGDLTIDWVRRTRIGGAWIDGIGTVPLSEQSEAYEIDILNSMGDVVRTISGLTSPTATYTAAQQTTDFGSAQSSINMKIYQDSATVGRGFASPATL